MSSSENCLSLGIGSNKVERLPGLSATNKGQRKRLNMNPILSHATQQFEHHAGMRLSALATVLAHLKDQTYSPRRLRVILRDTAHKPSTGSQLSESPVQEVKTSRIPTSTFSSVRYAVSSSSFKPIGASSTLRRGCHVRMLCELQPSGLDQRRAY